MKIYQKRYKNAEVSADTLVWLGAGLVGLMVLLFATGAFGNVFKSMTGKNECQMQFLISSFTKVGGAQTTEPECEPHLITITKENLTKNSQRAENSIISYLDKYKGTIKPQTVQEYESTFTGKTDEWLIDETIAKEMKYCWDVTGLGKLDLFKEWWLMLGYKTETEAWSDYLKVWNVGVKAPPTFCVLCARIKFEQTLSDSRDIDSLGLWMGNNPVTNIGSYSKVSYFSYIQDDSNKGIWSSKNNYIYSTEKSYAIVYARVNTNKAVQFADTLLTFIDDKTRPESVQMLMLLPYEDLKNMCTVLVG